MKLRNSELEVSRLCMGGCPMGGYGWGHVEEKEMLEAVSAALDGGINFFDTSDTYGLGKSEENYGVALAGRRSQAILATKVGVRVENGKTFYDNSRKYMINALEHSLRRLKMDYVDLYEIHYLDGITPMEEIIETMEEFKNQGKIRYYGFSNIFKEDIEKLKPFAGRFVCFQDEYSLACRKNEKDMFQLSKDLQATPLTWGSLGQGILTGKYDKDAVFSKDDRRSRDIYVNFHGEKLLKNLEIVEVLKEIAAETGKSIPSVAIRYILDFMPESAVIVGIKNPKQAAANLEAFEFELTKEQIHRLDRISL